MAHQLASEPNALADEVILDVLADLLKEWRDRKSKDLRVPSADISTRVSSSSSSAASSRKVDGKSKTSPIRVPKPNYRIRASPEIRASSAPPILSGPRGNSQNPKQAIPEPGLERYKDFSRDWVFRQLRDHEAKYQTLDYANVQKDILPLLCRHYHHLPKEDVARGLASLFNEYEKRRQAFTKSFDVDEFFRRFAEDLLRDRNFQFNKAVQALMANTGPRMSIEAAEHFMETVISDARKPNTYAKPHRGDFQHLSKQETDFRHLPRWTTAKPRYELGVEGQPARQPREPVKPFGPQKPGGRQARASQAQLLVRPVRRRGPGFFRQIGLSLKWHLGLF